MPRCCGSNSCACLIEGGNTHLTISGSGQASDPYVLVGDVALTVSDNQVFNLTLTGAGTIAAPWVISTAFASTAKLDDLPDVVAPSPTNAQVLGWDSGTSKWTPRAPTTAASGSVTTDAGLTGDGSGGSPLGINEDPSGLLTTGVSGLGLTSAAKNQLVRHFADSTARAAASPAPTLNALSMLDTVPGRTDYWDGSQWIEAGQFGTDYGTGELLALSGGFTGSTQVMMVVRQINTTTDSNGYFSLLSTPDLSGRAGVIGAWFQPSTSTVYSTIVDTAGSVVRGRAYKLTDGSAHASQPVQGTLLALVY